jgi:hypothetical protein
MLPEQKRKLIELILGMLEGMPAEDGADVAISVCGTLLLATGVSKESLDNGFVAFIERLKLARQEQ